MMRLRTAFWFSWLALFGLACPALAQTFSGSSLSYRSSGSGSGNWTLSDNGYVGTYFSLAAPGSVTLTLSASGSTTDAVSPHMNLVVADTNVGFDVVAGSNNYQHTFNLPAGTYFVRDEFNNDVSTANRQLTISSLTVSGATVSNTTSTATNDASALAAADTYIANFRQGPANVALAGVPRGAPVQVKMVRNAFNFGTYVQGVDNPQLFLAPVAPGDTTSTAAHYQNFVNSHFNILVPSNMGKWAYDEPTPNVVTMDNVDTILNYAQSHNMNARMHNLIWGVQQPAWVNTLLTNAQSSNATVAAQAKSDLMTAIANRIAYYVGSGAGGRSQQYAELDVLNEARREGTYWKIFGAQGVAQIYKEALDAIVAAGANTRTYVNEYNVFQNSNDPDGGASDPYANWYRRNVEQLNSQGFGQVVTGIGVQYNIDPRTNIGSTAHSASRMEQVLENLSITGLPITLSEFAVQPNPGNVLTTEARSAQVYGESLRMLYGSPQATSFLIWEPWPTATVNTDNTTIVDNNWNLRASGQTLVSLLDSWTTQLTATAAADHSINFTGYYGDYQFTLGVYKGTLSLVKGTTNYALNLNLGPGDYNFDGVVNAADYTVWRDTLGSMTDLRADGDGDGMVDSGDYNFWAGKFGTVYVAGGAGAVAAVPEPNTLALLTSGGTAALLLCRRKRRRLPF
ncbi:MAG TPA: endo-1,4-beta-xylanase [Lacipirellulaceae bacterium]|jgi:GH35 family endo-1,4-beta-xylanase